MFKHVHIEQTADGHWAVVQESIEGERITLGTFPSYQEAEAAAHA